jgi:hypothetical protein
MEKLLIPMALQGSRQVPGDASLRLTSGTPEALSPFHLVPSLLNASGLIWDDESLVIM